MLDFEQYRHIKTKAFLAKPSPASEDDRRLLWIFVRSKSNEGQEQEQEKNEEEEEEEDEEERW